MAGNRRILTFSQRCRGVCSSVLKGLKKTGPAILICSAIGVVGYGIFEAVNVLGSTDHFVLKTVEVCGTDRLDPSEIESACGLQPGKTEIFSLLTGSVERTCLEDARIEWVAVEKVLPDTLTIRVREARPVILVSDRKGLTSFNAQGRQIPGVEPDWAAGLPLLEGLEEKLEPIVVPVAAEETVWQVKARIEHEKLLNSQRIESVEGVVLSAIRLVASMEASQPEWVAGGVTVSWQPAMGFALKMPARPTVAFGFAPFEDKVSRMARAVEIAAERGLEIEEMFLDNESSPGSVTLRCHKGSENGEEMRPLTRMDSF